MTEDQLKTVIQKLLEAQEERQKKWYDLAERNHLSIPINTKTVFSALVIAAFIALAGAGWNTYNGRIRNTETLENLSAAVHTLTEFVDKNKAFFEAGPRYTKEIHDEEMVPKVNSLINKVDVLQQDVDYLKKEIQSIKKRGE